jgi:hypothetical protein
MDRERLARHAAGLAEVAELAVAGAAGAEAVGSPHRVGALAAEDHRVDSSVGERVADRLDTLGAALAELHERRRPGVLHEPETASHRVDFLLAAGLPEQAVFEAVGRRDQFVQREAAAGLLRDRVADVGVGVDERG